MFFTWGAWYGQLSKYMLSTLNADGTQVGNAYAAFSIATIIAPFFIGMIADKYFSAQRVMGILNIIGAGFLFLLYQNQSADNVFMLLLAYTLTFTPNIALSNSIAMNQMSNPEKEFPGIRLFGTIAWIVVTNIVGALAWGASANIFLLSAATSFLLGIFAFTLPDTPPSAKENKTWKDILGVDSFALFKDRSFLVFFISSILICIPLSFYYALANPSLTASGMENVENKMSLGQASEVLMMFLLPFAFQKFGIKNILIIGLLAWIIRFLCFGYGESPGTEWILFLGIILHGVCYDFFFVSGQIYTDQKAGPGIKNAAQGLITFATYGVGMGIGSYLSGVVLELNKNDENTYNYLNVWMVPTGIAALVLILFIVFFKDKKIAIQN